MNLFYPGNINPRPNQLALIASAAFPTRIVAMAGQAGVSVYRTRMAGAACCTAMENSTTMFIHGWLGMGQVKCGRTPGVRVMAGFAICAKRPSVETWVGVATDTCGRRPHKICILMARFAGHA